jgi:hypothetical protein
MGQLFSTFEYGSVRALLPFRIVDYNAVNVRGFVVIADSDGFLKFSNGSFFEGGRQVLRVLP